MSTTLRQSLRRHWPEYLIEAWALGTFMVAAGLTATLLGSPASPLSRTLPDPMLRNVVAGLAMGLTAPLRNGWHTRKAFRSGFIFSANRTVCTSCCRWPI